MAFGLRGERCRIAEGALVAQRERHGALLAVAADAAGAAVALALLGLHLARCALEAAGHAGVWRHCPNLVSQMLIIAAHSSRVGLIWMFLEYYLGI